MAGSPAGEPCAGASAAEPPPARTPRVDGGAEGVADLRDWKTFHTELRSAAIAATKRQTALTILMIHIDRIAEIEATSGSDDVERVVDMIGQLVCRAVPSGGQPGRYCADEFGLILSGIDLDGAVMVGGRLRAALAKASDQVTLSIGAAQYRDGEPLCLLIQRATLAAGQATVAGGDRVIIEAEVPRRKRSNPCAPTANAEG